MSDVGNGRDTTSTAGAAVGPCPTMSQCHDWLLAQLDVRDEHIVERLQERDEWLRQDMRELRGKLDDVLERMGARPEPPGVEIKGPNKWRIHAPVWSSIVLGILAVLAFAIYRAEAVARALR